MRESNSPDGFFIEDNSGSGTTSQEDKDLELATFVHTGSRYVSFAAPLMQKFGSDIAAINRLIETGEDLLESSGSRSNANTIKKNLMWLTSLKMMLEVINHKIYQGSIGISSPFAFPDHEAMNDLIAKYGANPDPAHFDNSTTRAFLIHFPQMLEQFLLMQSHLREYTKLTKFIDNIIKFDKLKSFDDGDKQYYLLFLAISIADQFEIKAKKNEVLLGSIQFPDELNVEELINGIEGYLRSDLQSFPGSFKQERLSDYISEIRSNISLGITQLTEKDYNDFINKSKLRLIELVISDTLVTGLYDFFLKQAQKPDFQIIDILSNLSTLTEIQAFKEICSLGFFGDDDINQVLKICDIEQKIQFSKQFLVLLNDIKYNKYNPEGVTRDGITQQYVYGFNPYGYILADGSTPAEFNSDKVVAGDISSLDEFWVKNNSSNIPQVLAYLYSDILHSGQNLFFEGTQIVPETLLTNPGYPFSLKALNIHAITQYKLRSPDLQALEGSLKLQLQPSQEADLESVAVILDDVHLDDANSKEASITDPKNNLIVKSGFELEVGIEDCGEPENLEAYEMLKTEVQRALFNKLFVENVAINESQRANIILGLSAVSRTELALLHLIFVNEIGENIAFMDIPREKMGQKVVEFLQSGTLKQKITDVIYAYEVNIHNPTSLHETVSIAKSLEQELYSFYETNFGVKVVQAPSFQLNVSPWVVDSEGQSNLADPSRQYSRKTMMREDGTVEVTETLSSIKNNTMYTRMIEEIGKELTVLIRKDTGVLRCSKVVSQIDWKAYPDRQAQFTQSLGSAYATHRIDSGKSATIRVFGEGIKTSRFEIRLFGPNVHMEAQMPNAQNFDERLFNQSEILDLIAEAVLKAFDTVNREMDYNHLDLSPEVKGFDSPSKPFRRTRSYSLGEDTLSRKSGTSGLTYLSSACEISEDEQSLDEPPTWLQLVQSSDEEIDPNSVCIVS
jgi:hypothetical protein